MGIIDRSILQKLLESRLLQKIFDKIYVVDLASCCCEELATADFTILSRQSYDNWLISFAKKMYKNDSVEFFLQMDLKRICASLKEYPPRYIVYCRIGKNACIREFQMNVFFADECQTQLIILREELTTERPRPLETINELAHCNERIKFLVNCLAENFIEINVETGVCRMFHAENGMQEYHTLKEQIAWWAENLIMPEEREAYIREYELASLLRKLKANNGYHSAAFTTLSSSTPRNLLIVSTLLKESFGSAAEYIFAYSQDITPMKEQETRNKQLVDISQQLLTLSQTEPVTGLFNRAACEKLIGEHLSASKNGAPGTMLLIDIDHFKEFNDQYGHLTGDFVLRYLGKTMQNIFRSDDIISRWGGDEFVVFMRNVYDRKTITSRIERLRLRLRQCKKAELSFPVTVSIGVEIVKPGMDMNILFDNCDKSLYQVKSQGRNSYFIHSN